MKAILRVQVVWVASRDQRVGISKFRVPIASQK